MNKSLTPVNGYILFARLKKKESEYTAPQIFRSLNQHGNDYVIVSPSTKNTLNENLVITQIHGHTHTPRKHPPSIGKQILLVEIHMTVRF